MNKYLMSLAFIFSLNIYSNYDKNLMMQARNTIQQFPEDDLYLLNWFIRNSKETYLNGVREWKLLMPEFKKTCVKQSSSITYLPYTQDICNIINKLEKRVDELLKKGQELPITKKALLAFFDEFTAVCDTCSNLQIKTYNLYIMVTQDT